MSPRRWPRSAWVIRCGVPATSPAPTSSRSTSWAGSPSPPRVTIAPSSPTTAPARSPPRRATPSSPRTAPSSPRPPIGSGSRVNSAATGDDHGQHERPMRAVAWSVGASAVPASVRVVALIGDHPQPELVVGGWLLMALATVAGAWLAGRDRGPREAWLGAAAGALLVIAGLHLLPDAWSAAGAAGIWQPLVPAVALGSFVVSGLAARRGCGCRP